MKKLTEGSIIKSILTLSIPIIFANLLQTGYQLIDTYWVGKLGAIAVAAVSLSFPVIFLSISLGIGIAIAGAILSAQYMGKGDKKSVSYVATQTLAMVFIFSLIISSLGYFLSPVILRFFNTDSSVYNEALGYMQISFIGMFFMFLYMAFQSLMRGVGEVKIPVYIVLTTVILNFFLDPLFIFGYSFIPAYGVKGAAIASLITEALSAIAGILILTSGKFTIKLELKNFSFDFSLIKKMFFLGFPASIEQLSRSFGMVLMVALVSGFGTIALAAYGIGIRVLSFVIIPSVGLSMATSTLVGQNIGANKIKRAEKIVKLSSLIAFFSLLTIAILFFVFSDSIASIFISGSLKAIEESSYLIKVLSISFPFIGIMMVVNGVFRGSGNTKVSMALSLLSFWIFRLPLAYILSLSLNEYGIWYAFPIADFISSIIALALFLRGGWKKKRLTEEIKTRAMVEEESIVEEGLES